jgi:hypothetical protein
MSALASNLKTLYQCPSLWFWHAIGAIFVIDGVVTPLTEPVAGQGAFVKYLLVSFWAGLVTASMMKETLGKPLTFCLPGHQRTVRSAIFAVGAAQALLLSLMVLAYPGLAPMTRIAGMASAAFLGMTAFLLAVWTIFLVRNAAACWGVPVLFLGISGHVFPWLRVTIEDAAIFHPWANAAVVISIGLWTWHWLGRREFARSESGSTFMPMQYLWNRAATERYNCERRIKHLGRHSNAMWQFFEDRFLARMSRLPAYSARRHAAGSRYALLGGILPASPRLVLVTSLAVVAFLAILGFVASSGEIRTLASANLLFVLPALLGMVVQIPAYSTLLVPAGRSTRFRTCLSIGARGAGFAVLFSASLFAVSVAIGASMPEISLAGRKLIYQPMDSGLILSPLLVIPLLYTCQLAFPNNPQIPQTVLLIATVLFALVTPGVFRLGNLPVFAVLAALCWWCFVGSLHHYCFHRDLALN